MAGAKQKDVLPIVTASGGSATGNPRNKVALKPGHSLMDWIRLCNSGKDLRGVSSPKSVDVGPRELAKHNTRSDAWMCVKGCVYNVTAYFDYHPGGEDELMRGVGLDATDLFNQVHQWVNIESMLQKCCIGPLKLSPLYCLTHPNVKALRNKLRPLRGNSSPAEGAVESLVPLSPSLPCPPPPSPNLLSLPLGTPLEISGVPDLPRFDWSQDDDRITLTVEINSNVDQLRGYIVQIHDREILQRLRLQQWAHYIHLNLPHEVSPTVQIFLKQNVQRTILSKQELGVQWQQIGDELLLHQKLVPWKQYEVRYWECTVVEKQVVTHDTVLLKLEYPTGCYMLIPAGCHVNVRVNIEGSEVVRSYTAVPPHLDPDVPVDDTWQLGQSLYLLLKIYPNGIISPELGASSPGDPVSVSFYRGNFDLCSQLGDSLELIILLAAGTGFTPMTSLLRELLRPAHDTREIKLFFFNKKQQDIIWERQLATLSEKYPRFTVEHVLSEPDDSWQGKTGQISRNLLEPLIPSHDKLYICVCGPIGFVSAARAILTNECGIDQCHIHAFTD